MEKAERDFFSVFVRGRSPDAVLAWVEGVIGPLAAPKSDGWPRLYESSRGLVLIGTPEDDEVSVWFHREGSWADLWGSLADCAEQASRDLRAEVLYFAGDKAMRAFQGRQEPAEL